MEKKYKVSKYNLHCSDSKGNLLLCNFMTGFRSLSIVDKEIRGKIEKLISKNELIVSDKESENAINHLYKIGFLVDENADEDALYDAKFYEASYSRPWQLTILPTHVCNLRCIYCYEKPDFVLKGSMSKTSQDNLLKHIQKNATNHSKLRVSWFGGEPLVAKDIVQYLSENILKICEQKKIKYESEMTTNAYSMEPHVFEMLYANKVYMYQITLDGLKKEHDKQRIMADGSGTFDKILDNLMYIRKNKQKYKLAIITLRTNATKNIVLNLDKFLEFYENVFASDERFHLRFTQADKYEQNLHNEKEGYLLDTDYLKRGEFLNLVYHTDYGEKIVSTEDLVNMFTPMYSLCYAAAKNRYVIDAELNIYKCTVHFDIHENKIGYINNKGDMIIDEKKHRMWYVRNSVPDECKSCFYLPCCNRSSCPFKYNAIANAGLSQCHVSNIREIMEINMRKLAKRVPLTEIKWSETHE